MRQPICGMGWREELLETFYGLSFWKKNEKSRVLFIKDGLQKNISMINERDSNDF